MEVLRANNRLCYSIERTFDLWIRQATPPASGKSAPTATAARGRFGPTTTATTTTKRDIPYPVSARQSRVDIMNAHYEDFLRQVLGNTLFLL